MAQGVWNKFQSLYSAIESKAASFTAAIPTSSSSSPDAYLCTAATVPIVCTLPSPLAFGTLRIMNSSSSLNVVTLSGTLVGNTVILPGQMAVLESNATSWYNAEPGASANVSVAVSSANILAFRATPKSLIPSPGAGFINIVEDYMLVMTRTGTAYANGGALEFRYTDGSGALTAATIAASVVTTGGAGVELNKVGGIVSSITPVAAAAIVMTCATAEFITGTGTAVVKVKYRVIPSA